MSARSRIAFFAVVSLGGGAGCGREDPPHAAPFTCSATAPTSCPTPAPRYADIKAIVQQNCAGPCHSGVDPAGPWPLTDYEHVADWADVVRSDLLDCSMPPADGGVSLSAEDRLAILTWLRCGFPE